MKHPNNSLPCLFLGRYRYSHFVLLSPFGFHPAVSDVSDLGWGQAPAFLTSSRVMLTLPVWRSHVRTTVSQHQDSFHMMPFCGCEQSTTQINRFLPGQKSAGSSWTIYNCLFKYNVTLHVLYLERLDLYTCTCVLMILGTLIRLHVKLNILSEWIIWSEKWCF